MGRRLCRPRRLRRNQVVCAAASIVMLLGVTAASPPLASEPPASRPCGRQAHAPAQWDKVIWVVFENHSYGDVIGASGTEAARQAPYLNALARSCGVATNYWGLAHPSLPNYLAMVSGSTWGVTSTCLPAVCARDATTIFSKVRRLGLGWRVYAESMPTNCRRTNAYPYVVRHNPAPYFRGLRGECAERDVPLGSVSHGRLADNLANGHLRSFSVVVPNNCHNTHDCSRRVGDQWLSELVPTIINSKYYRAGRVALFITYDEGAGGGAGQDCRRHPDRSCHVATVVVSPSTVPGTKSSHYANHYSLLKTTQRMLGIKRLLGHAGDRTTRGMRTAFNL